MLRVRVKTKAVWEILLRRNMTQNELAKLVEVSSGHLSQLVNGERCPSAPVRRKILTALSPAKFDDVFQIEEVTRGNRNGKQR